MKYLVLSPINSTKGKFASCGLKRKNIDVFIIEKYSAGKGSNYCDRYEEKGLKSSKLLIRGHTSLYSLKKRNGLACNEFEAFEYENNQALYCNLGLKVVTRNEAIGNEWSPIYEETCYGNLTTGRVKTTTGVCGTSNGINYGVVKDCTEVSSRYNGWRSKNGNCPPPPPP